MCLSINKKKTEQRKMTGKVVRWKVLYRGYSSPSKNGFLNSVCYGHQWKPGWNKSNRKSFNLSSVEKRYHSIEKGMHVCTTREEARRWTRTGSNNIMIKVICYNKDLIAVGQDYDEVYTKVFVPKDEYNDALKRNGKERRR